MYSSFDGRVNLEQLVRGGKRFAPADTLEAHQVFYGSTSETGAKGATDVKKMITGTHVS